MSLGLLNSLNNIRKDKDNNLSFDICVAHINHMIREEADLETGEYIIKTNDNSQASFIVYVTDEFYEDVSNLPEPYFGIIQGFDNSELTVKLEKGQYLYLLQNSNGQGKALIEKK